MPKELNVVANERIDLEDFIYGTRTFPVNTFREHVHRLFTGDYRGGFVLEGFRVEVDDPLTSMTIKVHNGIAVDRHGQLFTAEQSENAVDNYPEFLFNGDVTVPETLAGTTQSKFISIEFDISDEEKDQRAIWDPTFDNGQLADDNDDFHPLPKGKETSASIPIRKIHNYVVRVGTGGFPDVTDDHKSILIPIAVIPMRTDAIAFENGDLEKASTTIIERPPAVAIVDKLFCANTRIFKQDTNIKIINAKSNTEIIDSASVEDNDPNTNILTVGIGNLDHSIQNGDIVIDIDGPNFITEGNKYDCRPMFFASTDPISAQEEFGALATPLIGNETRNMRYRAGKALLNKPEDYTLGSTVFPHSNTNYKETVFDFPKRTELNIKNIQDFSRSLGTVIREMKYGVPTDGIAASISSGSEQNRSFQMADPSKYNSGEHKISNIKLITTGADTPAEATGLLARRVSTDMVGGTVTMDPESFDTEDNSIAGQSATITSVDGLYTLNLGSGIGGTPKSGSNFTVTYNQVTDNTKFVDFKNIGTLNEVYRARIDRVVNTYSRDLQERLAANKIPVVTVGDGLNTFGDYIGGTGLSQALVDVFNKNLGGIIYVKRGEYVLEPNRDVGNDAHFITSNTILMGDGPLASHITMRRTKLIALGTGEAPGDQTEQVGDWDFNNECNNIGFYNIGITSAPITDTINSVTFLEDDHVGRWEILEKFNSRIKNLRIDNVYFKGGSMVKDDTSVNRYMINLPMSKEGVITVDAQKVDRDILIRDSTLHIEGGGVLFEGAKDIKIDNCTFQSEDFEDAANPIDDNTSFVAMVEGIRFNGGSLSDVPVESVYGSPLSSDSTGAKVPGEVSITNCKFVGQQSVTSVDIVDTVGGTPRGWIYVDDWSGKGFDVHNCQFLGDRVGKNTPILTVSPPFYHAAQIQAGACITSTSQETFINIQSCTFNSYVMGVFHYDAPCTIRDCNFSNMLRGIVTGGKNDSLEYSWSSFGGRSTGSPSFNHHLSISNCYFEGNHNHANQILQPPNPIHDTKGIFIMDRSVSVGQAPTINIKGCTFNRINRCIEQADGQYSSFISNSLAGNTKYELVSVTDCVFNDVEKVIKLAPILSSAVSAESLSDEDPLISAIDFSNNSFINSTLAGGDNIQLSSFFIKCDGNKINNVSFKDEDAISTLDDNAAADTIGSVNSLFRFQDINKLTFNSNIISTSHADEGNWRLVEIQLGSTAPSIQITNNEIVSEDLTELEVTSGFYIESGRTVSSSDDNVHSPMLTFSDNQIKISNCNQVFTSNQFVSTSRSNVWGWDKIICSGNNIYINNRTLNSTHHLRYKNDIYAPSNFDNTASAKHMMTGNTNPIIKPVGYIGVLDFRRMSTVNFPNETSAIVSNNSLHIDLPSAGLDDDDQGGKTESIAGIRFTSWPINLTVSNNNLFNCPISINANWKCPDDDPARFGASKGHSLNILNNNIYLDQGSESTSDASGISKALSVSPFLGHSCVGTYSIINSILVSGNKIQCSREGVENTYETSFRHLVDFDIHSSRSTNFVTGNDRVFCNSKIINNTFSNCFLRFGDIDKILESDDTGLHKFNSSSFDQPFSLVISDNVKVVDGLVSLGEFEPDVVEPAPLSFLNLHYQHKNYIALTGNGKVTDKGDQRTYFVSGENPHGDPSRTPISDFSGFIQEQYLEYYTGISNDESIDGRALSSISVSGTDAKNADFDQDGLKPAPMKRNPVLHHVYNHVRFIAERNTVIVGGGTVSPDGLTGRGTLSPTSFNTKIQSDGMVLRYFVGIDHINPGGFNVA